MLNTKVIARRPGGVLRFKLESRNSDERYDPGRAGFGAGCLDMTGISRDFRPGVRPGCAGVGDIEARRSREPSGAKRALVRHGPGQRLGVGPVEAILSGQPEPGAGRVGAYLEGELVGFIQILYGDNIAIISNILSLQVHWDKSVNNALLAKAVEVCASKGERWLMYGRIGNHPSLDKFKENNGFVKVPNRTLSTYPLKIRAN